MKTALLLSYYYPPIGGIGSLRSQKFARYLPEFGWEPIVITPERGSSWVDPTLEDGTGRGVEVLRTRSINLGSPFKAGSRNGSVDGASNDEVQAVERADRHSAIRAIKRAVRTWVYLPDGQIGWFPYALRACKETLEAKQVDVIWSTSFPLTAHLIASRLKRVTDKPWIADFRDIWTDGGVAGSTETLRKRLDRVIQSRLLARADAIVTVSHELANQLRRITRGKKRVEVIRNGFDSTDFAGVQRTEPERWTTTFVGSYYSFYDPAPFFSALYRLIDRGLISKNDARLVFVGQAHPDVERLARRYEVRDITHFTGLVSNREALGYQVNSSILLFVLNGEGASPGHITGKLFEYLAARRPILGIVSPDFEAARIIQETGAGVAVSADDADGIERFLLDSYARFKSGTDHPSCVGDLSMYERKHTAQQLAELMTELTEPRTLVASSRGRLRDGERS
jgi:glycosyltransferase involved in cell wall biosynthesis